jgi:hypothetical protein
MLSMSVRPYQNIRLMGVDEEGTLRQLKAHRKELVDFHFDSE